ncbi:energy transducer TonB [Allosphingosinicella indica]|uniref:TonB family C-terminal domain-containing protein n=1 Tax=Allosphingosinicella indica TaxID=941907 RepID=A0A1X7G017_9SPHN|nr:energy transducer TonB [Allosphingosinicella indica]SMF61708.1 TonB family C-terminal domain-containing protein [Allosphingosinicella indica]
MRDGRSFLLLIIAGFAAATGATSAEAQQRLGDPEAWVTGADYPAASIARKEQGPVTVDLDISPEGRVAKCKVVFASKNPALGKATCAALERRARYTPAGSPDGTRVASKDTYAVRWRIPPEQTRALESDFGGAVAIGSPSMWFTDRDLPDRMAKRSGSGSVGRAGVRYRPGWTYRALRTGWPQRRRGFRYAKLRAAKVAGSICNATRRARSAACNQRKGRGPLERPLICERVHRR